MGLSIARGSLIETDRKSLEINPQASKADFQLIRKKRTGADQTCFQNQSPKILSKMELTRAGMGLGPFWRPPGSEVPSWAHLGSLLGRFCLNFGEVWGSMMVPGLWPRSTKHFLKLKCGKGFKFEGLLEPQPF